MGPTEAAEIILGEVYPKGLDTQAIVDELKARGIFTRSRDFISSVYASLSNASVGGPRALKAPKFVRKDGLWFLARERADGTINSPQRR